MQSAGSRKRAYSSSNRRTSCNTSSQRRTSVRATRRLSVCRPAHSDSIRVAVPRALSTNTLAGLVLVQGGPVQEAAGAGRKSKKDKPGGEGSGTPAGSVIVANQEAASSGTRKMRWLRAPFSSPLIKLDGPQKGTRPVFTACPIARFPW